MKVYFISGMGADSRVFRNIRLPEGFEAVFLEWIPVIKDESLEDYSIRMAEPIDRSEPFGLLGLSMGGMMVCEIAKRLNPVFTVLVSSVPIAKNLPLYYKFLGVLQIHKIIPISVLQRASLIKRLFTSESREEKTILSEMIRSIDPAFIRWSMKAVLNWKNGALPPNLIHIHGSSDLILPCRFTHPTHRLRSGGHLMVVSRAREINEILAKELPKFYAGTSKAPVQ